MENELVNQTCSLHNWSQCEKDSSNRRRSNIVLRDKRAVSEYRGKNASRHEFITLQVDDCIITSKRELKCDFLLLDHLNKTARLIELKGLNYDHGVAQIKNTMKLLGSDLKEMGYSKFFGKIAASRSPHIKDASYKKLKDSLYQECRLILDIRGNNKYEETLS
ncbi:hypothetical protein ACE3MS_16910 [Paenibacillus dendritiformis]|uniref:hypothetical protein n=1 Tax=Paenibacillus dendritiformis TaxID=130049 RepID=UPI0036641AEC